MKSVRFLLGFWAKKTTISYPVLILVSLLGVAVPTYHHMNKFMMPLMLGVLAAALTDGQSGSLIGRLKANGLTMICFAAATLSIQVLFHCSPLFAIGLFSSTFGFTMLGAIGPRYASIAFGSLLIAVYTMLGAQQSTCFWFQPALLLSGALWYYLLSFFWAILFPGHPAQQIISDLFEKISQYLEMKGEVLSPCTTMSLARLFPVREASLNAATVVSINDCKSILVSLSKDGCLHGRNEPYLKLYLLARDIHERVTSLHYRYQDLAKSFRRSDVLFRCSQLLKEQAKVCRQVSCDVATKKGSRFGVPSPALSELQNSIQHIKAQPSSAQLPLMNQLVYLSSNLARINFLISDIGKFSIETSNEDWMSDTSPSTLKDMFFRVVDSLNRNSTVFRHALRMSIALTTGYVILQLFNLALGYWIILTTLFVCQPNFSATKQRIILRVIGTASGLLIGSLLLTVFSSELGQISVIILSGVLFFIFRVSKYGYATGFATVLVLFCFNQFTPGLGIVVPRLVDTVIGCLLALAVMFIMPDWQSKKIHRIMADTIERNMSYLDQVIAQYRVGEKDSRTYRTARQNAHNQEAALTFAVKSMVSEPSKYRRMIEESFSFLGLSHALLSCISTLGAHRTYLDNIEKYSLIQKAHEAIRCQLINVRRSLVGKHQVEVLTQESMISELGEKLGNWDTDDTDSVRLILQQMNSILCILPELQYLASRIFTEKE